MPPVCITSMALTVAGATLAGVTVGLSFGASGGQNWG